MIDSAKNYCNSSRRNNNKKTINFISFIWNIPENRVFLLIGIILSMLEWLIFKNYYPNPNLIFDSYHYLIATETNAAVYAWPIGYSKFIRLLGLMSHSPNFLISFQYFFFELCFLLFFFSLRFLYNSAIITSIVLFSFFHLNPIYIYSSNLVISDILFTSLSLAWLTQILWIIFYPQKWMLILHALLLFLAFTVRYNALYYPFIAAIAILLSQLSLLQKITSLLLSFLLIAFFILFTVNQMGKNYGIRQFSPFGGWKLANDALYMYEHTYKKNNDAIPVKFQALDQIVKNYFNQPHDTVNLYKPDITSGSYYMYIYPSPLMLYNHKVKGFDPSPLNFKTFAPMGILYQEYGLYLIKKYPSDFFTYFLKPNMLRYLIPPQEVYTDNINPFYLRYDSMDSCARKWLNIKSTSASNKSINLRFTIFDNFPVSNAVIHALFIFSFIGFIILNGFKIISSQTYISLLIIIAIFLGDFLFSIIAAAIVLRYELFINLIEFSFLLIMIEFIIKLDNNNSSLQTVKNTNS